MSPAAVPMVTPASVRLRVGPLVHLVTSRSSSLRLAPLASELRARGVPLAVLYPRATDGDQVPAAVAMAMVEECVSRLEPGGLVVAGESDLALTCALAAVKLGVPVARLGAGLRCDDWAVREEMSKSRDESGQASRHLREEVSAVLRGISDSIIKSFGEISTLQKNQLEAFSAQLGKLTETSQTSATQGRAEMAASLKAFTDSTLQRMSDMTTRQQVAELLGVTPQAVSRRRAAGALAAVIRGREYRFPEWQFHDGATLPGLGDVIDAYPGGTLALSAWAVTPNPDLDNLSPAAALTRRGGVRRVVEAVHALTPDAW